MPQPRVTTTSTFGRPSRIAVAGLGSAALLLAACPSPSDPAQTTEADPSASDSGGTDPTDTDPTDTGSPNDDSSFPPGERVQCGDGWDTTIGGGTLSPLGFPRPCNPRDEPGVVDGYRCCSTDPATADGQLPKYADTNIDGSRPLYADAENAAGVWGLCVRIADTPPDSGLQNPAALDCPIPCDPTWASDAVDTVCGTERVCCQTTELGAKDCVRLNSVWRPVTGADIGAADVTPATDWSTAAHDTHQDPNATVCAGIGDVGSTAYSACIRQLTAADRRGFCMALGPGQVCPGAAESYVDACESMND